MPPRHAFWTILVDNQPTAFRAAMQDDLMPTFKRLKEKHPSAEMKWFQNGQLWESRDAAQEAMQNRGERGRMGDSRQRGGFRDRKDFSRPQDLKNSRPEGSEPARRDPNEKLEWKPKGEFTPAPKRSERPDRGERREWKPKPSGFAAEGGESRRSAQREGGKPKGEFTPAPKRDRSSGPQDFKASRTEPRREWKPKGSGFARDGRESRGSAQREGGKPEWKPKGSFTPAPKRDRSSRPQDLKTSRPRDFETSRPERRPEWKPKGEAPSRSGIPDPGSREKRKWIPKEEYKKAKGIEAPRDSKWRPGGAHRDPRQKYKDAKKAKWQGFKKKIRTRWEARPKKKKDE